MLNYNVKLSFFWQSKGFPTTMVGDVLAKSWCDFIYFEERGIRFDEIILIKYRDVNTRERYLSGSDPGQDV